MMEDYDGERQWVEVEDGDGGCRMVMVVGNDE